MKLWCSLDPTHSWHEHVPDRISCSYKPNPPLPVYILVNLFLPPAIHISSKWGTMTGSEQSKAQANFQYKSNCVRKNATFFKHSWKRTIQILSMSIEINLYFVLLYTLNVMGTSVRHRLQCFCLKTHFYCCFIGVSKVVNSIIVVHEKHCNLAFQKAIVCTEMLDVFTCPCYLTMNQRRDC